jgi:tetratricopeptide (TPR) repeat protein
MPTRFDVICTTPELPTQVSVTNIDSQAHMGRENSQRPAEGPLSLLSTTDSSFKGRKVLALESLEHITIALEENGDLADAEVKFRRLLDAESYLLQPAGEEAAELAHDVAACFAHGRAQNGLSPHHATTAQQYSTVGRLLVIWYTKDATINAYAPASMQNNSPMPTYPSDQSQGRRKAPGIINSTYNHFNPTERQSTAPVLSRSNSSMEKGTSLLLRDVFALRFALRRALSRIISTSKDDFPSIDKNILTLLDKMETDPLGHGTDIVRSQLLLVEIYEHRGEFESKMAALKRGYESVLSICCHLSCNFPRAFFQASLHFAETLLAEGYLLRGDFLFYAIERKALKKYGNNGDTLLLLIRIGKIYQRLKIWEDAKIWFTKAHLTCVTGQKDNKSVTQYLKNCLDRIELIQAEGSWKDA